MKKVVVGFLTAVFLLCMFSGCAVGPTLTEEDFQGVWVVDPDAGYSGWNTPDVQFAFEIEGKSVRQTLEMESEFFPGQTNKGTGHFYSLEIDGQKAYFREWDKDKQEYYRVFRVEVSGDCLVVYDGTDSTTKYAVCYR